MAYEQHPESSLQQRVQEYLTGSSPRRSPFSAKPKTDPIALHQYLLEKAERDLRAAQLRVDELRRQLAGLRQDSVGSPEARRSRLADAGG